MQRPSSRAQQQESGADGSCEDARVLGCRRNQQRGDTYA